MDLVFSLVPVTADLLPGVFALETASYPPDEAATLAKLEFRATHAAQYFDCLLCKWVLFGIMYAARTY
jgi:hypothetical protein